MGLLIIVELCSLFFAITTLSSVRAYVAGEGLWSKAQKDALFNLHVYAYSHDEKDYAAFEEFIKVPLGDRKARVELEKPNPDLVNARQGLLEGRNHPDDIDGMIKLLMRFHNVYYLDKGFKAWTKAETMLIRLLPISQKLHAMVKAKASQKQIDVLVAQIKRVNAEVTRSEDEFSFTLGEGARWLEGLVLRILLTLSLTIGTTSILITVSVSRGIERGINAIIDGADLIGQGNLSTRVKIYANDEIGMLAASFNHMAAGLERNITDLKETEEKLILAKKKAESSEKAKRIFLANMSHEIRTPMNAILGFAGLLQESDMDEEQRRYIDIIRQSGGNLLVILNDILDFSKIEAEKISFDSAPFHLRDMVSSTIELQAERATQKSIKLIAHFDDRIPSIIWGDAVRLNQILLNLISNAVKFTVEGEINIFVNLIEDKAEEALIAFVVKDTGIGICEDKQEKIFEVFEQASTATSSKFGGTGLGLSIVKKLVEMQGGRVSVKSMPGKGSVFSFTMAFKKEGSNDTQDKKTEISLVKHTDDLQQGENKRVLVVEDNPINSLLVTKVLKKQGYETDLAENGKVAIEKYEVNDYDIILMDLQMPEMDGYETTIHIRKLAGYKKNIPIIAMTAHTIKGEFERCIAIGMNNFISKPFQPNDLYEKMNALLQKG
ncbi:hypothetical protein GCM10007352_13980 [Mucilaginibacter phyllosphaerae]|nr:hypothetical protein GCM10007352_13980 [Mucilaginibacter phyllosphaerae]